MIVTGIRTYTPIRQSQNFVGKKKDVPDNKKPNDENCWSELHDKIDAKIEKRRRSSVVSPNELKKPMTI